jgi:hypothetical protein
MMIQKRSWEVDGRVWLAEKTVRAFAPETRRFGQVAALALTAIAFSLVGSLIRTANAQTFDPAVVVNSDAATDSRSDGRPSLATDGAGNWVAVWQSEDSVSGDIEVRTARSSDGGATWAPPVVLLGVNSGAFVENADPSVATDGLGTWLTVWISTDPLGGALGSDPDILVSRSTDLGATWSAPQGLNSKATTDNVIGLEDFDPRLAADGLGNWVAVWESDDKGAGPSFDIDIFVARSSDGGLTWSAQTELDVSNLADTISDFSPVVETNGAGNWVAAWHTGNTLGGTTGTDGDLLVSRSSDAGLTWSAPTALNSEATTDGPGDSEQAPELASDGAGTWVATWGRLSGPGVGNHSDLFVARSVDAGATWSAQVQLNTNLLTEPGFNLAPDVDTDSLGNWLVVWPTDYDVGGTIGTDTDLVSSTSIDGGVTWTAPVGFASAATDGPTDVDSVPALVFDGAGHWLAAWLTTNSLGGTIGTDSDIVAAKGQAAAAVPALGGAAMFTLMLMLVVGASRVLK